MFDLSLFSANDEALEMASNLSKGGRNDANIKTQGYNGDYYD